jgi:SAM-dependent methyltransferase
MPTMPAPSPSGQPENAAGWFAISAGQALLRSETETARTFLERGSALAWLWIRPAPDVDSGVASGRGLRLATADGGWTGDVRCWLPLPLASESIGSVLLQHVLTRDAAGRALLEECTRVLVPGGRLGLFALNPLSPYRWRWRGHGLQASEPLAWRRRLRAAGLVPEPLSQGIGPSWREGVVADAQQGVGLRAAYLLQAEKRSLPLTPVRVRRRVRVAEGVPAT